MFSYVLYYIRDICDFASSCFPYCVVGFFSLSLFILSFFLIVKTYCLFGVMVLLRDCDFIHSFEYKEGK